MSQDDLARTFTIALLGVPALVAAGAWLIGLVLHGLGRSTTVALGAVVFAIGAVMGGSLAAALGLLQQQATASMLFSAVWLLAVPLIVIVALAMTGRRRTAGLLLAGVATPWTIIWGVYLVALVMGEPIEPLLAGAMLLAGLGPLLIGVALAAAGDPVYEPDPSAPMGRPGSRRLGSMGKRLTSEATYGAVGPSIVLTVVVAAAVSIALPSPALQLVVTLVAAVVGTELELRWIPPAVQPAIEAFHAIGRSEQARFRAATGSAPPTSIRAFRQWLAHHPETDATRPWRVEILTGLGEYGQARSELGRVTAPSGIERLHVASLGAEIDWGQGGESQLGALRTLAAQVGTEGSAERREADGLVAWWASRVELAAMEPAWRGPLARHRARLGKAANGLHVTSMRRRTLTPAAIVALCFVLIGQIGR